MKNKKRNLSTIKILPWYMGFSDDLLFYMAINTIFLTVVKNFNASQISLFTSIPCFCYILLQPILLKIIKWIGNKNSVVIGSMMLLLASIIITFSKSFYLMMLGQVIYTLAFLFKSMDSLILKNNLIYLDRENEFLKYESKSRLIYSILTTIIALVVGYLFSINYYLPMFLCIGICFVNLMVSFILSDVAIEKNNVENSKRKVNLNKLITLIIVSYGLFFSVLGRGQANLKLVIQYSLNDYFSVEKTAIYFSYILFISRIFRVLSNVLFNKFYNRLKNKLSYFLTIVCAFAFLLVIFGNYMVGTGYKFLLMGLGFCLILGIRDIFLVYIKDLLLKNSNVEEHSTLISYFGFVRKIVETIISFGFSIVLLRFDIIYVVYILLFLTIVSFLVNYKIYKMINRKSGALNES